MWPFDSKKIKALEEQLNEMVVRQSRVSARYRSVRAYAGAQGGRLMADWLTSASSADAEIRSSLTRLRDRSRSLCRDNDYVRSAMRTIRNNVVGQGIGVQSQARQQRGNKLNDKLNKSIEAAWWKWQRKESCHTAGRLCFSEIERLIMTSVPTDGEVFVRLITQRMGKSKVPLALEIIESDMVDENYNDALSDGRVVRMGVEQDKWGRPIAFHILPKHPGDLPMMSASRKTERIRVPASEIIPLMITERPGQTRGVPWLASSITRLRHMGGYEEAEVVGARVAASSMGLVQSPAGEIPADDVVDGQKVLDYEPGTVQYLAPGETFTNVNMARPGGQYDPFMRSQLRGFSAGLGSTYETTSNDYSQSNYSSSRLALLDARDNWRVLQWWLIENFHQVVFERWLPLAVLSGEVSIPDFESNSDAYLYPRWMPRGWSWVDPAKEVSAYKDAIRSGLMTQADVIAQTGGDFEELISQRQREVKLAEASGLVFDTNPAEVDGAGKPAEPAQEDVEPSAEGGE